MADREKVIMGLELCKQDGYYCYDKQCPYEMDFPKCVQSLLSDALELLKAQETGWISVKDRLPKTDKEYYSRKTYIVSTVHGYVLAMEYVNKPIRGKMVERWEWNGRISPWEVTYWMPMPEPLKEET